MNVAPHRWILDETAPLPRGGVEIDDHCRTSAPGVYATGECASWRGRYFGLVAPGYAMAAAVAEHLGGRSRPFVGSDPSTRLKLLGVEVASSGDAFADTPGARSVSIRDDLNGVYKKLVLTDLDREQLLRTLDRFLAYYIRSADRLERTSTWLSRLEGGISRLAAIVLDDALGLGAELEAQITTSLARYRCAWRDVLESPEKLERFRPHVSAEPAGAATADAETERDWTPVCRIEDVPSGGGVCVRLRGLAIAVFRLPDGRVFALDDRDPSTGIGLLSRGLVGDRAGTPVVISPLHQHVYSMATGECLGEPGLRVARFAAREAAGRVKVGRAAPG